jgi:hypothetical protein
MSAQAGTKRRWLASAIGAAIILGGLLLLFRAPVTPPASPLPVSRPIAVRQGNDDELAMRDLAPLFLPTARNAGPREVPHREPGRTFFDRDAEKPTFAETNLHLNFPVSVRPPSPSDLLADSPGPLVAGFGEMDIPPAPAATHGAFIEVIATATGRRVLAESLAADARPPANLSWQPLEMVAAVNPAGLVGPLVVTARSGVDEVDNHFRNYLAERYRLGDRLAPGFYRIIVGP